MVKLFAVIVSRIGNKIESMDKRISMIIQKKSYKNITCYSGVQSYRDREGE